MKKYFISFLMTAIIASVTIPAIAQNQNTRKAENDTLIAKDVRSFLQALNSSGGTPLEKLSPEEARNVLVNAQQSVAVDYSGIEESEKTIGQDGLHIRIHIVKPAGAAKQIPVFMYFHGGGWVLGDYPTHRRMVRDLVVESGVAAVFVDYTASPEAHYPVAINQAYAATKWVAAHGEEIGVDGKRLAVARQQRGR